MTFSITEIVELLAGSNDEWLFSEALKAKESIYGREVFLRGIIEHSNYCRNDCLYCGLRVSHKCLRYRLDEDTVIAAAHTIVNNGISSIVLQAGEDYSNENIAFLDRIIPRIKEATGADITLSHGNFPREVYARWKALGANRYLLKLETLQAQLHSTARPHDSKDNRLEHLQYLLKLGYQVGSGFIAGMPGYTDKMLAEDMLELSRLGVHMFSLSPFIATPDTPWENEKNCNADTIYRATAIYRLLDPQVNIPVTNALNVLDDKHARSLGLKRGCNVVMHSFTPQENRAQYEIYPGKGTVGMESLESLSSLKNEISALGLHVTEHEPGRSKKEILYG